MPPRDSGLALRALEDLEELQGVQPGQGRRCVPNGAAWNTAKKSIPPETFKSLALGPTPWLIWNEGLKVLNRKGSVWSVQKIQKVRFKKWGWLLQMWINLTDLKSGPPTDAIASAHFSAFSSFSRSSLQTWQALGWTVAGPMITRVSSNWRSHHVHLDFSTPKTDNTVDGKNGKKSCTTYDARNAFFIAVSRPFRAS